MPPKDEPQPSGKQRNQLVEWVDQFLLANALKRAGDPGLVLMRRLTNAEYNYTVADLTGIDLRPARQFPEDSVAGEGFANVGEALVMSPTQIAKYLEAARQVSAHAVLTPLGLRFSTSDNRHDWTAEAVARIQATYARYVDLRGQIPLDHYLDATLQYRERDRTQNLSLEQLATQQNLSAKYLQILWKTLNDPQPAVDVAPITQRWSALKPGEAKELVEEIAGRQEQLWKFNDKKSFDIGSIGLFGRYVISLQEEPAPLPSHPPSSSPSFAQLFPLAVCFADVVPTNDDVTIELFLREDEAFCRLLLEQREIEELDRLWDELLFISRAPIEEAYYITQFIIDQPANRHENTAKLADRIPALDQRAAEFKKALTTAEPKQLDAVVQFASRAWRRPLDTNEQSELRRIYQTLREDQRLTHDDAIGTVLTRILLSPNFLYRSERPASGDKVVPVSNWELASRLSYFLWSTLPDDKLRILAAENRLLDTKVLADQTRRMLADPHTRALAVEFACQWFQFRGIDEYAGKSETRFPTFTPELRQALNEESVRFISDLFRNDRSVLDLVRSDYTFLNEELAKHYNIPNVQGANWRRVDGVSHHGRGGLLAMGSLLAKQSGALRTSPVLRGIWVVETLLGRELSRPPEDVPQLAEDEVNKESLTMRQLVQRHRSDAVCASCHEKFDPYGFLLEAYDAIGQLRTKDLNGNPIDDRADLSDGTTFEGLNGLQDYLLKHQHEFLHQFCRKLLGYALGREVELSDKPLLEQMLTQLESNEYRFSAAVLAIIESNQFRHHRGFNNLEEISP